MSPSERTLPPRPPPARGIARSIRFHLVRWLPLVGAAVVGYALFPPPAVVITALPAAGQVAERTVVAPFSFETPKSDEEVTSEGESRAFSARPVYRYSPTAYDSALAKARSFFAELERADQQGPGLLKAVATTRVNLGPAEAEFLTVESQRRRLQSVVTHFLAEVLSRGVADAGVLRSEPSRTVSLRRAEVERVVARDSILSFADLIDRAEAAASVIESPAGQRAARRLVGAFYHPTVVPDLVLTSSRREQLRASVDPVKYYVSAGERITTVGQPVTEVGRAKLAALQAEVGKRGSGHPLLRGAAGALLYNAVVMAVFWVLLLFYKRETYDKLREVVFFGVLFSLVLLLTAGLHRAFPGRPELVPIPFAAIVVTLLYNGRVGLVAAMTLAILLDGQWALRESSILFFGLVSGVAGAVGIRVVRRRWHLYLTIGAMAAGSVLASVTVGLIQGWSTVVIVASAFLGMLMALASASLAMIVTPIAESATRITTDLTLLELSDLGRPLLRRLAQEAPGTWAHSLAMANLCESACNIIGANGLLARVGCYYHDVGKLANPRFFIENQAGGPNPHDDLVPSESGKIIRNHVLDGLALAEDAGLPDVVKAFIPEHHGTTEITYFLSRARLLATDGRVNPADFRYPGPRPQSAETAVAMLADSAEAVVRVLDDRSPDLVREAIEQLVAQKLASGQLDDAPLSLVDIDRIKREFARVMSGTYHKRIGYPRAAGVPPELETAERA
ncbi:MAG: HDIG domain-containing protein [Gemmatimonadales bacterium]|nr:HDIG domain-containing protein [Gemmatimonadales bacterium]